MVDLPAHTSQLLGPPKDIPSTVSTQQPLFDVASAMTVPSQEVEVQHCWQLPASMLYRNIPCNTIPSTNDKLYGIELPVHVHACA